MSYQLSSHCYNFYWLFTDFYWFSLLTQIKLDEYIFIANSLQIILDFISGLLHDSTAKAIKRKKKKNQNHRESDSNIL